MPPEIKPALVSIGNVTLLGASAFRSERELRAYWIGIQVDTSPVSVGDSPPCGQTAIRILGARPNPTHASTRIRFEYGGEDPVTLCVFDADGRLVSTLAPAGDVAAGSGPMEVMWDGRDDAGRRVGSGVFFYGLRTPATKAHGRLVVLD